jgi:cell division protein FtsI (penicillin-binding protein 3)
MAVVVALALTAFAARLVWVQAIAGPSIAATALSERLTTVTELALRGEITDADGVPLAVSVERYDVAIDQREVAEYEGTDGQDDGAAGVAAQLAPLLGLNAAELGGTLVGDRQYVPITKGVLPDVAREIRALHLRGVMVDRVVDRVYPKGNLAGNILGFVNSSGEGLQGLEMTLDDELAGTPGEETYERGAKGQAIPGGYTEETPATDGASVRLTLLSDVQWKAQQALDAQVAATGAASGSIVVMDAHTGAIYALADSGTIDPNDPGEAGAGALSRAVSDVFEPGSTGKVVTMAAALEEGVVTPTSTFDVPYQWQTPNGAGVIKDSHEHPTSHWTTTGILAESSNVGTVMVGSGLTVQQRYDYLAKFGFGSRTGIEMPGESAGILHPADEWDGRTQYNVLFGQGVSVNAIQAASVYQTIANGGVRVTPHLVAGVTSADGTYTPAADPASEQVVSATTAQQVLTMLESAVDDGTGTKAAIAGYRVAGKTGTAQELSTGTITASFIGAVPADDPQIVVAVVVHDPKSSVYGGTVAAPVFSDVAAFTLTQLGIAPSGVAATLFPMTW